MSLEVCGLKLFKINLIVFFSDFSLFCMLFFVEYIFYNFFFYVYFFFLGMLFSNWFLQFFSVDLLVESFFFYFSYEIVIWHVVFC